MLSVCINCLIVITMLLILASFGVVIKICCDLISAQKQREKNKDFEKYKDVRIEPDPERGGYRIVLIPADQTSTEEGK